MSQAMSWGNERGKRWERRVPWSTRRPDQQREGSQAESAPDVT